MRQTLFTKDQIEKMLDQLAEQIIRDYPDFDNAALVGIRTGGIYVARRLQKRFEEHFRNPVPVGILDINLYRDDFDMGDRQPEVRESSITFPVEGKTLFLVDDVLFTGRTVRAALDAINDYGRPAAVRLVALVDRGHRELPIEANYVGSKVETKKNERITVTFTEIGPEDLIEKVEVPKK
jgi:pyrimidine operon attenuation protein / uracil phosphoribosyltransferase